jgi:hypothetical protein
MSEDQITTTEHREPTQWFHSVRVGQVLKPIPLYNHSEREPNRLPATTEVLEIEACRSQSGIRFKVMTKSGGTVWLDAGWFEPPTDGE